MFPFILNYFMYMVHCGNGEREKITTEFSIEIKQCSAAGQPRSVDGVLWWRKVLLGW